MNTNSPRRLEFVESSEPQSAQLEPRALECGITIDLDLALGTFRALAGKLGSKQTSRPGSVTETGRVLRNRYVLETRLAGGGKGTVFKALDRYRRDLAADKQHVAIKILHETNAGRALDLSNLRREFYCAQSLAHENVVKVFELDSDDEVDFFTMELLEGELLSAVLARIAPRALRRSHAWAIIRDVGAGVAHAHSRAVVHGDLKPQNIMITRSGDVRVLDFGAATREVPDADPAPRPDSTALTPAYASCELLNGQPADPRDDLYALACMSYELLSGEHPFQGRRASEAREHGMRPRRPSHLTGQQWRTLAMGLAWQREDRTIAVSDWLAKLDARPRARPAWRVLVLPGALLIGMSAWLALNRVPTRMHSAAPSRMISAQPQFVPTLGPAPIPVQPPAPAARPIRSAVRAKLQPAASAGISIATGRYRIRAGQKFVELRVRRSSGLDGGTGFSWWTEASSAIAGADYVAQDRIPKSFSKDGRVVSLFVKILPNADRKPGAMFYVVIGDPSSGSSLGRVSRAAIFLPPS